MLLRRLFAMLVPLLTLVVVVGLLVLAMQHFDQGQPEPVAQAVTRQPQYTLDDAEWTRIGADGKPVFHITAQTIDYYPDESITLHTLTMDHLAQGTSPWRLTAPLGEVPAHQQRVRLENDVIVTGQLKDDTPLRLTTTQLWVDQQRQQIYTDQPVTLTGANGQQAHATGMLAQIDGDSVQLLHNVKVDYAPAAKK
ncbi:MAG TPA: LPS export ABC transporter periplasmic protein LptC [Stenotrophobium sp.]|jgi:LPS export ABC transporter protein LptC|nr:LPS export ABC transporter periplasmic protein LptC [Stenotrophobium sp.]